MVCGLSTHFVLCNDDLPLFYYHVRSTKRFLIVIIIISLSFFFFSKMFKYVYFTLLIFQNY